jgi:tRNA threonylcarbamoyladenosine biosynthesis protein TsaE
MLNVTTTSLTETQHLAELIGKVLQGGEVLELISDVGGGKTSFIKGLARGLGVTDIVLSPTFTISRIYTGRDELELHHFDLYRLEEAGIIADELSETLAARKAVVAIEWSGLVHDVLPATRAAIRIAATGEHSRLIQFNLPNSYNHIAQAIEQYIGRASV